LLISTMPIWQPSPPQRSREAAEGETLAMQGDLGHAMFAIESGTVEVSADGEKLATLGAGDAR
jgi:CRP-like cAMP-binding protein